MVARLFPPEEQNALKETVHQAPDAFGLSQSRWTLEGLRQACQLLESYSLGGIWSVLRRLGLRYKRGQLALHSPDPAYADKVARLGEARQLAASNPSEVVLVYGDEMSYYRRPTLARVWHPSGRDSHPFVPDTQVNTRSRLAGALDEVSGKVVFIQRSKIGLSALKVFLKKIRQAYPDAKTLFLVWDNWPVHHHPQVVDAAQELRITILWLPTYAPWLNAIEKLWRWLKHEVLHMHRRTSAWTALKQEVDTFLEQFDNGSYNLLRYTGLLLS